MVGRWMGAPMPEKVSIPGVLKRMTHAFEPETVARIDHHQAVLVRYEGGYPSHMHDADEFLLCLEGEITVKMPDGEVTLKPHEGLRIPAGTLHAPRGTKAVGLLFESATLATRIPATAE